MNKGPCAMGPGPTGDMRLNDCKLGLTAFTSKNRTFFFAEEKVRERLQPLTPPRRLPVRTSNTS
jgi:hypothetical protein